MHFPTSMRTAAISGAAATLLVAAGGYFSQAAQPERTARQAHPSSYILPGCAMTLVPDVSDSGKAARCLKHADPGTAKDTASRAATFIQLAENGPWPPRDGWVISIEQQGQHTLPPQYNDKVSSWGSFGVCGNFYLHAAGTTPWYPYSKNSTGNFPYGPIGNDQLSGVSVEKNCA